MRLLIMLLLGLLLVLTIGCGGGASTSEESVPPAEPESAPADTAAAVDTAGVTS